MTKKYLISILWASRSTMSIPSTLIPIILCRVPNMMAWGHEIIHGFDTNGAKFDQVGNWGPLWANENDSLEFQKWAQQLIDYYSSIDIMPFETGLKNDGAYTVAENVADLGGFYLAYDSYVKHLQKQGFTGDQLRLQK